MISFSDRRLPISLLVSKALLIVKALSDITFGIKSAFDSKSAFRYHFWMQKCKIGAFGKTNCGGKCHKRPASTSTIRLRKAILPVPKPTLQEMKLNGSKNAQNIGLRFRAMIFLLFLQPSCHKLRSNSAD